MGKKVLKYKVWLAVLIGLISSLLLIKAFVGYNFEKKVEKYRAESLLGYSEVEWSCLANTSKCKKKQVKITHKNNDVNLLCFEIFDPESPLRKLVKGVYRLTLPLPEIVNEILPAKNEYFEKTELYQQCIAAVSAGENSLVARVAAPGVLFEIKSVIDEVITATTVLTKR